VTSFSLRENNQYKVSFHKTALVCMLHVSAASS